MHYKDGTEAKVGDLVKGTTYNRKGLDGKTPLVLVGEMLQITPGSDTCNCIVGFSRSMPATIDAMRAEYHTFPRLANLNDGPRFVVADFDYSECKALELVHRPA